MRVLLISHTCQSATEGQPKAVQLARMAGLELCVLVPDRWCHYGTWRPAEVRPDLADVVRVGRVRWPWVGPGQYYLHHYPGMAELIRTFKPDVIDLWEESWGLVSVQACRLRSRLAPSAKIVSETEQNVAKRLPPPFEQFRRYVLRRADFVVARSDGAAQVVRDKGYAGPVDVVPNAVDAELFRPMDRAKCKAALGASGFVVGYVGRLVPQKGLFDLLEAVARAPKDVNLLLVGSGPMEGEFRARSVAMNLDDRVRVLPEQPLAQLPTFMNAVDVLAVPSRTTPRWKEQFGRVIIEAHACGTPVIGSDSGAIPNVVGSGGMVVPEGDAAALADAVMAMRDGGQSRSTLGNLGYEVVRDQFTWARVAERMHEVYRRVLA